MNHWLLKTEPSVYSYSDLVRDKQAVWDGVTSPWALKNIRQFKKGDLVFIYHTGGEKQVVGIAEVVSSPYPDPKAKESRLYVFDIRPKKKLGKPVTLQQVKADKRLRDTKLVKDPRLSVQPVPDFMWKAIIEMGEEQL